MQLSRIVQDICTCKMENQVSVVKEEDVENFHDVEFSVKSFWGGKVGVENFWGDKDGVEDFSGDKDGVENFRLDFWLVSVLALS